VNSHANLERVSRDALPFMHKGPLGRLDAEGRLVARARERGSALLYGPYWRLAGGLWRLSIAVRTPARGVAPCLAVEIVADNRNLAAAAEFSPADCAAGELELVFAVSEAQAAHRARFEFRILALGGADLTISSVALSPAAEAEPTRPRWSLLARLRLTPLARLSRDGVVRPRLAPARGPLVWGLAPSLRLPAGAYALRLQGSGSALRLSLQLGETELLRRDLSGGELAAGCEHLFRVPEALGLAAGGAPKLALTLTQRGGDFALARADLVPVKAAVEAPAVLRAEARLVVVGNCQAEALTQALMRGIGVRRLRAKYHFMWLSPLHLEAARRDLAACDVVLMQRIDECDNYTLRSDIPGRTEIVSFPCLRLAALWPFDSANGPQDHAAFAAEGDDRAFAYLDWRLAELRQSEPDPEARLRAYAELGDFELKLVKRMAGYEARRLKALDREFSMDIGAYVEANYRERPLFHTTTHPGPELLRRLRNWTLARLDRRPPLAFSRQLDLLNEW